MTPLTKAVERAIREEFAQRIKAYMDRAYRLNHAASISRAIEEALKDYE